MGSKIYRDADGLRVAMKRCTPLAAKVLANEYARSCSNHPSLRKDPRWLEARIKYLERELRERSR